MNHIPARILAAPGRPLTRRALAKLQTRQRVLNAAKALFTERGYDGATIRDIAAAAGMSTGAVFASFSDKSDLFNEVIIADYEATLDAMREAAAREAGTAGALSALFTVAYEFHLAQLPLAQAGISVSWSRSPAAEQRNREGLRPMIGLVSDVLSRGVERGELPHDLDVRLIGEMIWDSYLSNYRRAAYDGWALEALVDRLNDQIGVILAGSRKAA